MSTNHHSPNDSPGRVLRVGANPFAEIGGLIEEGHFHGKQRIDSMFGQLGCRPAGE